MALIMKSLESWKVHTAGTEAPLSFYSEVVDSCDLDSIDTICIRHSDHAEITRVSGHSEYKGYTYRDGDSASSNIWIDMATYPITFKHITEHEIGHALGLHHAKPGTLMCYDTSCASEDITDADVQQYLSYM